MRHQQNRKIARQLGFVSKIVVIVTSGPGQEIFLRMKLKLQDLSLRGRNDKRGSLVDGNAFLKARLRSSEERRNVGSKDR
jgi:hypothetical protein